MSGTDDHASDRLSLVWQVYHVPILLGCFSLLLISISITIFIKSYQSTTPITFSSDEKTASRAAELERQEFSVVDIEGAVEKPGIYRLPIGSRVDDVIAAAGGITDRADYEKISRTINRAAKIADGAKLFIPFIGGEVPSAGLPIEHASTDVSDGININTASMSELESLSGVGTVTAEKIINNRPYMRPEELVEKKVISNNLFEKLKNQLQL